MTNPLTFDGAYWIWTPEATHAGRAARAARVPLRARRRGRARSSSPPTTRTGSGSTAACSARPRAARTSGRAARRFMTTLDPARNVIAVRTTNGAGSPAGLLVKWHPQGDGSEEILQHGHGLEGGQDVPRGLLASRSSTTRAGAPRSCRRPYGSGPWGRNVRAPRDAARPAPLLRREFAVSGTRARGDALLRRGRLRRTSRSTARPASKDVLTPGFTDYDDTVQYTTADLTKQLQAGTNALGAELGRGFYGMTGGNVWRWESPPWHDEPVVRARLRIEYTTAACRTSSPTTRGGSPTARRSSTTSTAARPTTPRRLGRPGDRVGRGERGRRPEGRARQPAPAADPRDRVAARDRDHRAATRTPTSSSSRACSRAGSSSR